MWESLGVAGSATVVSVVVGMAVAWLLVNRHFPGDRELGFLASAALAIPAPVICYFVLLSPSLLAPGGFTLAAVLSAAPLLVRASRSALDKLDPLYGKTARSVGASDWRIFWRVELPLVWGPVAAAAAIAFLRVLAELAIVFFLSFRFPSHD